MVPTSTKQEMTRRVEAVEKLAGQAALDRASQVKNELDELEAWSDQSYGVLEDPWDSSEHLRSRIARAREKARVSIGSFPAEQKYTVGDAASDLVRESAANAAAGAKKAAEAAESSASYVVAGLVLLVVLVVLVRVS